MHYFLTEDEDFDDDDFEEGFYIFWLSSVYVARFYAGFFIQEFAKWRTFL